MAITIGRNIASLRAQRQLGLSTDALSQNYERLSSGLRINHASDDAAGLSVSSTLRADSRIYTQALRNANDGITVLNVAGGTAGQLTGVLTRLKELAEQSSNGVYSLAQRRSMNTEAKSLTDEYNRLVQSTKFNNLSLLDGSLSNLAIQLGVGTDGQISFGIGNKLARTAGLGSFATPTPLSVNGSPFQTTVGDFNGDGKLDILSTVDDGSSPVVNFGRGDGTFQAVSGTNDTVVANAAADINGDGKTDLLLIAAGGEVYSQLSNGDASFAEQVVTTSGANFSTFTTGDFNGDGKVDVVGLDNATNKAKIYLGDGAGHFNSTGGSYDTGGGTGLLVSGDINGDGNLDIALRGGTTSTLTVLFGNGSGGLGQAVSYSGAATAISSISIGDLNLDGVAELITTSSDGKLNILVGNADGTLRARTSYDNGGTSTGTLISDFNGDGIPDILAATNSNRVNLFTGVGDGTLNTATSTTTGGSIVSTLRGGDFNNDGVQDFVVSDDDTEVNVQIANTRQLGTIGRINLSTQAAARSSLAVITAALSRVSQELGNLGSIQARLESSLTTLAVARENFSAAESRISNVDVASESASLVRNQIKQQVGSAILAQANQSPQITLRLLEHL